MNQCGQSEVSIVSYMVAGGGILLWSQIFGWILLWTELRESGKIE